MSVTTVPQQTILRYRGDSAALSIPLFNPDTGAAFDPTGSTLLISFKLRNTDPDSASLVQKFSSIGGIIAANPANLCLAIVSLVPADFGPLLLSALQTFYWSIRAQLIATGETRTVAAGTIWFDQDISQIPGLSIPTNTTGPAVAGLYLVAVPPTLSSPGSLGQIAIDGNYIYVCAATNTWLVASLMARS